MAAKGARVINFSAGPGHLPEHVLEHVAATMLNYDGSGMSVMGTYTTVHDLGVSFLSLCVNKHQTPPHG